jgi:hypothetical protein
VEKTILDSGSSFNGFDHEWYVNVGIRISLTIFLSTFSTNFNETKSIIMKLFARFKDRGYKLNLKKDLDNDLDDEVNTQLETQEELEALYLGEKFAGEKSIARMMSVLLICFTFSAGMPVLYLVGFLFFSLTFLTNKFALIYYY